MDADILEPYRDLRRGPGPGRFVVEGALAVERLIASGLELESLVCTPSQRARLELPTGAAVVELSRAKIAELVGFEFHRGVLACARRPPLRRALEPRELDRLRGSERARIVVAEGLADPRNLGALIRNAAAFGVDLVIADARGADLYARLTIRASVGNVFRVPTLVCEELPAMIDALAGALPAAVVAATPAPEATALGQFEAPARLLLLVGNEGAGLSSQLLARAEHRVRIPVAPGSDSLNVAAATAVLLHGLTRTPQTC
ncbi:putative TrmH family tRNA/rRNA methyltransferase [Enhygromyxa salina]|uniref:Putative TrmH family tRNA/rRNA methyltransferase n=1 Tax=Enhygromyxa salina TaxID=215803 RepID=A0A2S9XBK1_9BACT|nr:RNA methyltransferase [Enhygromyxa salina]PRP90226.1 putative TrmH family tRNA/rRNA methyltransferase [Enhygromyxa salina]